MTFDELLESYDPIDVEYRHHFADKDKVEPMQESSFIPTKEELEKIFFVTL